MGIKKRGPGEGSIYERKDGRWAATISLGFVNGKRQRKTIYGATHKEVKDEMARLQVDIQRGLTFNSEKQTVAQFLQSWLETVEPNLRPKTYISYEATIRLHITPYVGNIKLSKLSPQNLQQMMGASIKAGATGSSVSLARSVLRIALGQALKWGLVVRNVATLVNPPKYGKREIQFLTPDQAKLFLDACHKEEDRLAVLYTVSLALGLRVGEVTGLRWEDVDLTAGTVKITASLQRIKDKDTSALKRVETKTKTSKRILSIPTELLNDLKDHKKKQLQDKLFAGPKWVETGLVFTTFRGTAIEPGSVPKRFNRAIEKAGLPKMRFHDLRHSCTSLLLAAGVDPRTIMEVLGHSTLKMTMEVYAHVLPSLKENAAQQMNESIFSDRAKQRQVK